MSNPGLTLEAACGAVTYWLRVVARRCMALWKASDVCSRGGRWLLLASDRAWIDNQQKGGSLSWILETIGGVLSAFVANILADWRERRKSSHPNRREPRRIGRSRPRRALDGRDSKH